MTIYLVTVTRVFIIILFDYLVSVLLHVNIINHPMLICLHAYSVLTISNWRIVLLSSHKLEFYVFFLLLPFSVISRHGALSAIKFILT